MNPTNDASKGDDSTERIPSRRQVLSGVGAGLFAVGVGVGSGSVGAALGPITARAQDDTDEAIEIEDWTDLNDIRERDTVDCTLVAELTEETAGYDEHVGDPDGGFEPIPRGTINAFHGNQHTIADLVIDRPDEDGIALFDSVSDATIRDVTLADIDVTGNGTFADPVGGLAAELNGEATIENVSVSGTVVGTNGDRVGMIAGNTRDGDVIVGCEASGSVAGSRRVGGVIGRLGGGEIFDSHSSATVTGIDEPADPVGEFGGLVGDIQAGGLVRASSATGDVDGIDTAGGLAGQVFGRIERCVATGAVTSDRSAGGLVNDIGGDEARIEQSYARGSVSADTAGGLAAFADRGATIQETYVAVSGDLQGGLIGFSIEDDLIVEAAYWDVTVSGTDDSVEGTGLETAAMQGAAAVENMDGFDFEETWDVVTDPDDYPILQFEDEADADPPPEPPQEWTEAGLSEEQFAAVDQNGDGELSRGEVRNAVEQFITEDTVNGVEFTRAEIRSVINVFIRT